MASFCGTVVKVSFYLSRWTFSRRTIYFWENHYSFEECLKNLVEKVSISCWFFQECCRNRNGHVPHTFLMNEFFFKKINVSMMTSGFWKITLESWRNLLSNVNKSAFYMSRKLCWEKDFSEKNFFKRKLSEFCEILLDVGWNFCNRSVKAVFYLSRCNFEEKCIFSKKND